MDVVGLWKRFELEHQSCRWMRRAEPRSTRGSWLGTQVRGGAIRAGENADGQPRGSRSSVPARSSLRYARGIQGEVLVRWGPAESEYQGWRSECGVIGLQRLLVPRGVSRSTLGLMAITSVSPVPVHVPNTVIRLILFSP